jgi:hypothetical protein
MINFYVPASCFSNFALAGMRRDVVALINADAQRALQPA